MASCYLGCPFLISCFEEEVKQEHLELKKRNFNFTGTRLPTDSIFRVDKKLKAQILKKFKTKTNVLSRTLTSEDFGFSIDTSFVQIIRSEDYDSYTFLVERDEFVGDVLENYILTYHSDGHYSQLLVSYPIVRNGYEISYDIANGIAQVITDDNLVLSRDGSVECLVPMEEWQETCSHFWCASGAHIGEAMAEMCDLLDHQKPFSVCTGSWVTTGCAYYGSGGGTGGPGGGGGGGPINTGDVDEEPEIPVIPLDDLGNLGVAKECKKISDLFLEFPNYKQKLINLATTVNEDHENATGIYDDGTDFDESGTPERSKVYLNENPASKYRSISHTHNEFMLNNILVPSYSIFSMPDLQFIAQRLRENELNGSKFVAFLTTAKGTRYAMTIHNTNKFLSFFKYVEYRRKWQEGQLPTSIELNYIENVVIPIQNKYFDKLAPNPAPIKINNINNHDVLLEFLKFMNEADLGISLFKVNATFDSFERLKLNEYGTDIIPEFCNN